MARNIEIKARIDNMTLTRRLVADAADRDPETLSQTDTFFHVDTGRLKLREFSDVDAELIYYRRPDATGPTESQYERVPVSDALAMRGLLASSFGIKAVVSKKRLVYWVGRTRVHLDEVRDLGNFLELEVVLEQDEDAETGVREAQGLMKKFEICEDSLVSEAYVDLLHREGRLTQN